MCVYADALVLVIVFVFESARMWVLLCVSRVWAGSGRTVVGPTWSIQVQPGSLDSEAGMFAMSFDQTGSRLITCEADKTVKARVAVPTAGAGASA